MGPRRKAAKTAAVPSALEEALPRRSKRLASTTVQGRADSKRTKSSGERRRGSPDADGGQGTSNDDGLDGPPDIHGASGPPDAKQHPDRSDADEELGSDTDSGRVWEADHPISTRLFSKGARVPKPEMSGIRKEIRRLLLEELVEVRRTADAARNSTERIQPDELAQQIAALVGIIQVVDEEHLKKLCGIDGPEIDRSSLLTLIRTGGSLAKSLMDDWSGQAATLLGLGPKGHPAPKRTSATTKAQRQVRCWYGMRCMLTDLLESYEGAHIIGDCVLRNQPRFEVFWVAIKWFWPEKDVKALGKWIRTAQGTRQNILPLGRDPHCYWGRSYFTFRPCIPQSSSTRLVLEFFWLNRESNSQLIHFNQGKYTLAYFRTDDAGKDDRGRRAYAPICSGDQVEITTTDPEKYPLPSIELLQLQWLLCRALRAVAAADVLQLLFRRRDGDVEPVAAGDRQWGAPTEPREDLAKYLVAEAMENGIIGSNETGDWLGRYAPLLHGGWGLGQDDGAPDGAPDAAQIAEEPAAGEAAGNRTHGIGIGGINIQEHEIGEEVAIIRNKEKIREEAVVGRNTQQVGKMDIIGNSVQKSEDCDKDINTIAGQNTL